MSKGRIASSPFLQVDELMFEQKGIDMELIKDWSSIFFWSALEAFSSRIVLVPAFFTLGIYDGEYLENRPFRVIVIEDYEEEIYTNDRHPMGRLVANSEDETAYVQEVSPKHHLPDTTRPTKLWCMAREYRLTESELLAISGLKQSDLMELRQIVPTKLKAASADFPGSARAYW